MEKTTAGKVGDDYIGKYIELYVPAKNPRVVSEVVPVPRGHGKLVNYRKRGNDIDFIFAGNFDYITVRQTCLMQVFKYDNDGNLLVEEDTYYKD